MNFSDKLKEMSDGYAKEVVKTFDEGVKPKDATNLIRDLKKVGNALKLPTKELTPTDVVRAGVEIVEGALKNVDVFLEDKEHGEEWSEMMILYLETLVSILFDCNCKISRFDNSEEDEDE